MQGMAVFKHAVRSMTEESQTILARNGISLDELDLFIPHQANLRIIKAVGERLGIDESKVSPTCSTTATPPRPRFPWPWKTPARSGALKPGMKVLLTSFGGGMTWGSALLA